MKALVLQIVAVCAGITGFGFTVTITVNVGPLQVPDFGVTIYVAVNGALVLLVNVPEIEVKLLATNPAAPPVIPVSTVGAGQEYVVPAAIILLFAPAVTGVTVNTLPLQTDVTSLATVGFGFTVTVTVKLAPKQVPVVPEVGVTV